MKIALAHTPLTAATGGERQLLMLAIGLQKKGHEVEIFTNGVDPDKCFPELLRQVKVNVVPAPAILSRYPLNIIFHYYRLYFGMRRIGREIAKRGFDVVNNHNFPSEWAVYYAKKRKPIPAVWMCNEPPFWFFMPGERKGLMRLNWPLFEIVDRKAARSVDRIVALSHMTGSIVKDAYGIDHQVVRSGVDAARFGSGEGEAFRKKHGLEGSTVLMQVGTVIEYKRQEDSVKALASLSKEHPDVRLVIVGIEHSGYKGKLIEIIKASGLEGKVLFLGPLSDAELMQAYAASDIFLFPAFQSWSLVATEAMAAKKPVIVSDKCGVSEIIEDGVNGFKVTHGDYVGIASRIERLIGDKGLMERIGANAFRLVSDKLTWEIYVDHMENILKETAGK